MGDSEQERRDEQHRKDRYELGEVDSVNDLEPETGVGKSRKTEQQERLVDAEQNGYFEAEAGQKGGLGAQLHLGEGIKKDGGSPVKQYEAGYNAYSIPLRSALRSMGRVKDVSLTGAPMTVNEFRSRPDLKSKFRKLKLDNPRDRQGRSAMENWSQAQTSLKLHVKQFGATQHQLAAALATYRAMQKVLERHRVEARKQSKEGELAKIEECAKTLATIVETTYEGWKAVGEIQEKIDSTAPFNPNAEGSHPDDITKQSDGTKLPDWTKGLPQPNGAPTRTQKTAGHAQDLADGAGAAWRIAQDAKKNLAKNVAYSISLEDVFTVLTADGKDVDLKKQIAALNTQIETLNLGTEAQQVYAANQQLLGMKIEFAATQEMIQADRQQSRGQAKLYGEEMDQSDEEGAMAMYAAEAYQELASFGELAVQQRKDMVDPLIPRASGYAWAPDKPERFIALQIAADGHRLQENLREVKGQRQYFTEHLPKWQQLAAEWQAFLKEQSGVSLTKQKNSADEASSAP